MTPRIEIALVQIPNSISDRDYRYLLSKVSASRRERINKFVRQEDANRSLIGESLVRAMACAKLNVPNECIHFKENAFGKPAIVGWDDFHFNCSHSGDWVAVICSQCPVGIAIEQVQDIEYSIAERFFSVHEVEELMIQPKDQKLSHFYQIWTLKESYIKAVGKGLSIPLDSFTIRIHDDRSITVKPDTAHWHFRQYPIPMDQVKLSACSAVDALPTTVTIYELNDIYLN